MYTVYIFQRFDQKICYIKELNNSIQLDSDVNRSEGIFKLSTEELLELIHNESLCEYTKFVDIIEKNKKAKAIQMNKPPQDYSVYVLCMHPSRTCNLACKYCFAKDGKEYLPMKGIDIETAKKAVDFLVDDYGRSGIKYQVDIAGSGEPLLKFDFIQELEKYCEYKSNETGKEIKIMFPTNATLLTDEMIDYFNHKYNILLGVSLDGNERQSANRLTKNGENAYQKIAKGAKTINRAFGIAVTITHINEDVDEVYDFLYHEFPNADSISMQFVRNYELDSDISFYQIDINNLVHHYEKLVEVLIEKVAQKDYEYVLKLLRGADTFGKYIMRCFNRGSLRNQRCGAGKGTFCVDDNGDIYSCSVANGDEHFKIGSLSTGIDSNKQEKFKKANVNESDACRNCWAAYICGGECLVKAYLTNQNMYEPNPKICELKRNLIELAVYFVETCKHNYKEAYEYFRRFRVDATKNDTSLWVIHQYLKSREVKVSYQELADGAVRTQRGFAPNEFYAYVKQYDSNFQWRKLSSAKQYEDVHYPAIAFANKNKYFYQYAYILGVKDGILQVKDYRCDEVFPVPIDDFFEEVSDIIMDDFLEFGLN